MSRKPHGIAPNITAELNESDGLTRIEILGAGIYIRDAIMETVQAKVLDSPDAGAA
jgi:hypothetical protein